MRFSFQHPVVAASQRYDVVDALAEADFAVVDADSRPAVKGVVQTGYAARSVFVGGVAPAEAVAHLQRPIDTTRILRTLDELVVAHARMPSAPGAVDGAGTPPPRSSPAIRTGDASRRVAERAAPARDGAPTRELPILSEVVADPYAFFDTLGDPPAGVDRGRVGRPEAALYDDEFRRAATPAAAARLASGPRTRTRPDAPLPVPAPSVPFAAPSSRPSGPQPPPSSYGRRSFDAPPGSAPTAPDTAPVLPPNDATAEAHGVAKAAARAKARRARFASSRPAGVEPLRDVLVVGPDVEGNLALCTLLERFGFQPVVLSTPPQAHQFLVDRQPALAAVFLDLPLDDGGLALLQRIRTLPTAPGHSEASVHLVAAAVEPADRVRVALARLPEPMIKPLARGGVARALERSGVPFPADARRH